MKMKRSRATSRAAAPARPMIRPVATLEEHLRRALGDGLLTHEPLRHHTTFRIGGPADYYFAAHVPDHLVAALRAASELGIPVFLLGGGSNLVVSDEGFRGLVVRNACDEVEFDGTAAHIGCGADFLRSEERRVGKGWRSRGWGV